MPDIFKETTSRSWGSRIKGAFSGILFGLVLFIGAFVLLFWNEGRAVQTYKTLQEGAGSVISASSDQVLPENEGALVHVSGKAYTTETLADPLLNVSVQAIRLIRRVEMLQWHENKKSETRNKLGGGTETITTYSYTKKWSSMVVNSSGFKHPRGHENPTIMPVDFKQWQAEIVNLGAFTLTPSQVSNIRSTRDFPLTYDNIPNDDLAERASLENGIIYIGSRKHRKIGDARIMVKVVYPNDISIIAKQSGRSFVPYKAEAGGVIDMLKSGLVPARAMFEEAQKQNTILTWGLRFLGLMLMFVGLKLILRVIRVLADVVPLFGSIIGAGTGIVAFLLAFCLSLVTISIAWIFYRPLIGAAILAIAAVMAYLAQRKAKATSRDIALRT
jgi:hypothetical protein